MVRRLIVITGLMRRSMVSTDIVCGFIVITGLTCEIMSFTDMMRRLMVIEGLRLLFPSAYTVSSESVLPYVFIRPSFM